MYAALLEVSANLGKACYKARAILELSCAYAFEWQTSPELEAMPGLHQLLQRVVPGIVTMKKAMAVFPGISRLSTGDVYAIWGCRSLRVPRLGWFQSRPKGKPPFCRVPQEKHAPNSSEERLLRSKLGVFLLRLGPACPPLGAVKALHRSAAPGVRALDAGAAALYGVLVSSNCFGITLLSEVSLISWHHAFAQKDRAMLFMSAMSALKK